MNAASFHSRKVTMGMSRPFRAIGLPNIYNALPRDDSVGRLYFSTRYSLYDPPSPFGVTFMKEAADRIRRIRDFSPLHYSEAEDTLKWWAMQNTAESVQISFDLLYVILQQPNASAVIDFHTIQNLTYNWQKCWKNNMLDKKAWNPIDTYERLFQLSEQFYFVHISGKCMSIFIDSAARMKAPESSEFCEMLLRRMIKFNFNPSVTNLNAAIHAWSWSTDPNAPTRAAQLMHHLSREANIEPDIITYNSLLHVYARFGRADLAEELVTDLCQAWLEGRSVTAPTLPSINTVMLAWSRSDSPEAGERAHAWLKRLYDPKDLGKLNLKPDKFTFNTLLNCWSSQPEQAHSLLHDMKEMNDSGEIDVKPDLYSYTTIMNAYAKAGNPAKAEALLSVMYARYAAGDYTLKPNIHTLTTIVEAWTRSKHSGHNMERAKACVDRMHELHGLKFLDDPPDMAVYNVLLKGYCRNDMLEEAEKAVVQFQKEGLELDVVSYSTLIHGWAKRKGGSLKARDLLLKAIEDLRNSGCTIQLSNLVAVLKALALDDHAFEALELLFHLIERKLQSAESSLPMPDMGCFSVMMGALYRSHDPRAARKAEQMINQLQKLYKAGLVDFKPDSFMYEGLARCWCRSKDNRNAFKHALRAFEQSIQLAQRGNGPFPHVYTYNMILLCLARGNQANLADKVLENMIYSSRMDKRVAVPDVGVFNRVLYAWARIKDDPIALVKAESWIEQMHSHSDLGTLDARPDTESFNHLIQCWINSKRPDRADRAEEILKAMLEQHEAGEKDIQPNIVTYGLVIEALCQVKMSDRAIKVLKQSIEQYKSTSNNGDKLERKYFELIIHSLGDSSDDGTRRNELVTLFQQLYPGETM